MSVKAFWCWLLVVQQHALLVTFTAHTFEQPPQPPPCISIRNADSAHSLHAWSHVSDLMLM